jgi:hypothetical protein
MQEVSEIRLFLNKQRIELRESRCANEQATDERASAKAVALTRIRFLAAFDCCIRLIAGLTRCRKLLRISNHEARLEI